MSSNQSPWKELMCSGFPIRILAVVYPTSPLFPNTQAIEDEVLQELHIKKQHTKHLVSEMWPSRTTMVFDYRHDDYDFANGHNCEHLRTIVVHFIAAEKVRVGIAEGASNETINNAVAELHRLNGDERPPFIADHRDNQVPEYHTPRDMI
ncbi:hypothetical protein VE04_02108 [Pseudogymnoascus sp. 24MN13]|nr:hypothetical protein VE04_02108 [Pseudogymnoascus sp. 24MN13]